MKRVRHHHRERERRPPSRARRRRRRRPPTFMVSRICIRRCAEQDTEQFIQCCPCLVSTAIIARLTFGTVYNTKCQRLREVCIVSEDKMNSNVPVGMARILATTPGIEGACLLSIFPFPLRSAQRGAPSSPLSIEAKNALVVTKQRPTVQRGAKKISPV